MIIGDTPILPELGTTITGAIANLYTGATVVIYSAANDTVTFTDNKGTHQITTNSTGRSDPVMIAASTTSPITFTSSVAKNPNNLSVNYTKSVAIYSTTTSVYVMPDGDVLYWFGYDNGIVDMTNANGWQNSAGSGYTVPTHNTNYIDLNSVGTNNMCGVATSSTYASTRTCKVIGQGITGNGQSYGGVYYITKDWQEAGSRPMFTSSLALLSHTPGSGTNRYFAAENWKSRTYVYAMWIE